MKKRLLLLLCLIATAGSTAWAGIIAQGTFKNGGSWKITDDGELYVDAKVIPDFSYGLASGSAIVGMYKLHNYWAMVINGNPAGSYYRFTYAFPKCCPWYNYSGRIKSIRLSANVETIGEAAFADLYHVETITFEPRNAANITIKQWAFNTCKEVKTLDLTYVKEIGDNAFANCFALTTVKLGDGLQRAGKVFAESEMLFKEGSYIYLPNNSALSTSYWNLVPDRMDTLDPETHMVYHNMRFSNPYLLSLWNAYLPSTEIYQPDQAIRYIAPMAAYGKYTPQSDTDYILYYGEPGYWLYCPSNHSLTIDKVVDYATPEERPWHSIAGSIESAYIHGTKIGRNTFNGCTSLHFVNSSGIEAQFPRITEIGDKAFYGCTNLKMANLSDIESIGISAFEQSALQSLKLRCNHHVGFNSIGSRAFCGTPLQYVYVYGDSPATANDAFNNLTSQRCILYVPAYYSTYYEQAPWSDMVMNKIIDFPVSEVHNTWGWELTADGTLTLKSYSHSRLQIGDSNNPLYPYREFVRKVVIEGFPCVVNAFVGFENLTTVEALDLKEVGENLFKNCTSLTSIELPKVERIDDEAFAGCTNIVNYTFGSDLKYIGKKAFDGCKNVDVMALTAANPPEVTAETFQGMGSNGSGSQGRRHAAGTGQKSVTLDVPEEYLTKYLANRYWKLFSFLRGQYGNIVSTGDFGDGLWILYDNGTMVVSADKGPGNSYAEASAQALGFGSTSDPRSAINLTKHVEFMGNITHLGWGFQHFPNLESVRLCPSIMRLDDTFESCAKLTDINLEYVDTIGDWTFARSGVQNIELPYARYIGRGAFYKCKELQTVSLGTSCEICKEAFFYCDKLTDINLADAHLDGAHECFSSCYKLKNVTFSGKYLPSRIFSNCFALERIDLGTRVDSISFDAFDGCNALNTVYCANPTPPAMPWGKRKIGEEYYDAQAFYGRNLKNIHLYLPAGFQFPYSKADVWKGMTFETDLSYTEDLLPTGGAVGEDGTWYIDTDGTLTLDFEGGSSSVNIGGSNIGWHDLLASWMPFLTKVVVSDRVNYVPYHMAGEHDPAWSAGVESVELGASVKTLRDQSLNYSGIKDVYCYAESCPSCSRTAFDWDAIAANNATLHVVTSQGVLERYQNSKTWSKFPNIVADLTSRMPAGIFSVTNPEGLVMWFRVTDEAAKTCETYHNDVVGKAIEYNSYGHYERITVPATVTYNGDTYKVTGIGDNSFYGCTNVDTFVLPEGLERIGVNAFNYCFGVHEFTLPASVQYIGEYAFEMWTNIERFTVNGTTPPTVDENFMNTYWDPDLRPKPTLLVPDGCRDAWNVEPWNKWFNVVDPFNKGVLTYKVIPGASFYDYYQNDEEYMCIEGLMALGIITYQDEMVGREWDELIGDWNEIWGNVYYNKNGKKLFYLDDESCIRIFDGVSSADNIYYEFKTEDYETMMYTTGRNVDLYKGAAIIFPESNVQTDIYFTATNADGIDISYRVLDLSKKTCEVKADPNGYGSNAVSSDVSDVKVPFEAGGYVVTGIAADAFNSMSGLQVVTLPASIRNIGANAFGYCENVVAVYMESAAPPMLLDQDGFLTAENNMAFESIGVPAGTEMGGAMLYVPYGSEEAYDVYPWNYWFGSSIQTDPDGIKSLTPALSEGEGVWYDLSGRKLGDKPAKSGLYIHNGKKVVIK